MTDDRSTPENPPVGAVDASGQPASVGSITPPEQPPMSDDASGKADDSDADAIDRTSTDDLSVQGGDA